MTIEPASRSPYWFPAKRYGWGWGPPTCWQGWAVLAVFAILVAMDAIVFAPPLHPLAFVAVAALLCAVLILVCFWKGEPPRWRWGG